MKRRAFITLLGGAAAWPLAARAQQPAMPVIGVLDFRSRGTTENLLRAFREGLKETGYVEGENVALEYRWADDHANTSLEIEAAFAGLARDRSEVLFVGSDAYFYTRRVQLTHLATHHRIAAAYAQRDYVEAGGLMSYGSNLLRCPWSVGPLSVASSKARSPADLRVVQSSKFDLVINLPTARALGIEVPPICSPAPTS